MSNRNIFQVEVNVNFCFYVDVESISAELAAEEARDLAYEKAEEIVGDGNDEEGMIYGIGQPVVGSVDRVDEDDEDNEGEEE